MRRATWLAGLLLLSAGCGGAADESPIAAYTGSPEVVETIWAEGSLTRVDGCVVVRLDQEGDDVSAILQLPSDAGADLRWHDDRLWFHHRSYPMGSTVVFRATRVDADDLSDVPEACQDAGLTQAVSAVPGTTDLALDPSATVIGTGDQLRVPVAGLSRGGRTTSMRGDLAVVGDRCLGVEVPGVDTLLIWPFGTTVSYEPDPVVLLPDGTTYAVGDRLELGGGYTDEPADPGEPPPPLLTGLPEECQRLGRFLVAPV